MRGLGPDSGPCVGSGGKAVPLHGPLLKTDFPNMVAGQFLYA